MKIAFLSDLHGASIKDFNLDNADVILLNGDFSKADLIRRYWYEYKLKGKNWKKEISKEKVKEAEDEIIGSSKKILNSFGKKPVYFVYGNVEKEDYHLEFNLKKNVHNINQRIIKLNGIKIAGAQFIREKWWIDKYAPERYDSNENKVKRFLEKLGKVDILLCHNPPYGYLDINNNPKTPQMMGKHHGSKLILEYIQRKQPKYCLCGHIHEAKGKTKIGKTIVINGGLEGFERILI